MNRSQPLRRSTPLKRTRMRQAARKPHSRPGDSPDYLARVDALPCIARHLGPCIGDVSHHHMVTRARLGDDTTAVPMCHGHHIYDWHGATGVFKGWGKEKRREFAVLCIGLTRSLLAGGSP